MTGLTGKYSEFLNKSTTFDLVPESGKLVVLDVALSVQIAFQALRENGKPLSCLVSAQRNRHQICAAVGYG